MLAPLALASAPEKAMMDLRLGDCLEVMHGIPNASVDLILTDLPYGVTQCRWDQIIPLEPLWKHYKRLIKPRGAIVLTAIQPFTSMLVMSNPKWFKYSWVWGKNAASGHLNAPHRPMTAHEDIIVFSNSRNTYNPQYSKSTISDRPLGQRNGIKKDRGIITDSTYGPHKGKRIGETVILKEFVSPRSLIFFDVVPKSTGTLHPTQKPVALMEYLIKTYTNEGETVLDSCMGSGTTGIACLNTGRAFIGIEKDPDIFATAERRIAAELDKHVLFAM